MRKFAIRVGDRLECEGYAWVVTGFGPDGVEGRYRLVRGRRGPWRRFTSPPDSWCALVAAAEAEREHDTGGDQ